ncbi:MAG: hypothetical protein HC840_21825 [Leptolyngbyaceae cyanobacterium RM2_2_4]|nr:hypothetical protein [Leptolyngbyaceae cyanobacterium SM1_4_3]NJN89250.1 hypothetical protein [Leptolyngbyaceae cyanobacterium SL_5_14]NJO51621.1 hypothetical protein [Leptolyngbyaceae cyanobacterium RM2_2_4]NJO66321.1 hypothetical protein [Leptolyngbyaceae cyanobacterium RM1_405_57]
MTDRPTNQSSTPDENKQNAQKPGKTGDRLTDKTYDVMDLVSKGGYEGDPQEILGNPAVTPETYQEGRDLRVDLYRDADEVPSNQDT